MTRPFWIVAGESLGQSEVHGSVRDDRRVWLGLHNGEVGKREMFQAAKSYWPASETRAPSARQAGAPVDSESHRDVDDDEIAPVGAGR